MSDKQHISFPVLPTEEQIKAGVFDRKNSCTPDAQEYKIQPITTEARPEHFQAAPGPVIPQDTSVFENKPSREEILAKTAELNKKD
ncbi:hypothetical protein BGX38DRAFT_1185527 [Terfezia claveryi]|nr:hypothetical protein BGX38DRAFT_1185527 [Terfezia claveryi]